MLVRVNLVFFLVRHCGIWCPGRCVNSKSRVRKTLQPTWYLFLCANCLKRNHIIISNTKIRVKSEQQMKPYCCPLMQPERLSGEFELCVIVNGTVGSMWHGEK